MTKAGMELINEQLSPILMKEDRSTKLLPLPAFTSENSLANDRFTVEGGLFVAKRNVDQVAKLAFEETPDIQAEDMTIKDLTNKLHVARFLKGIHAQKLVGDIRGRIGADNRNIEIIIRMKNKSVARLMIKSQSETSSLRDSHNAKHVILDIYGNETEAAINYHKTPNYIEEFPYTVNL